MSSDYEIVMDALFAQLIGGGDFVTTGRRVLHWNQVSEQPALFLRRTGVLYQSQDLQVMRTLICEVWIYSKGGEDPDAAPDETLTDLEAKVLARLAPDVHDDDEARFTLGGLVYWCRVEGRSDMGPGDQAGQAVAKIPILVTLP